jgi:hypothetical protein
MRLGFEKMGWCCFQAKTTEKQGNTQETEVIVRGGNLFVLAVMSEILILNRM